MGNHRFDRYCALKGYFPRFRRRYTDGQIIECSIAPGYITLKRGHTTIYVPRSVLIPLLKWLIPKVKEMDTEFDPQSATQQYLNTEALELKEFRRQKKGRRSGLRTLR